MTLHGISQMISSARLYALPSHAARTHAHTHTHTSLLIVNVAALTINGSGADVIFCSDPSDARRNVSVRTSGVVFVRAACEGKAQRVGQASGGWTKVGVEENVECGEHQRIWR